MKGIIQYTFYACININCHSLYISGGINETDSRKQKIFIDNYTLYITTCDCIYYVYKLSFYTAVDLLCLWGVIMKLRSKVLLANAGIILSF